MSNVLIGILGVIMFVGLALAGATFFGPVVQDSVQEGHASGTMRVLSDVANAVAVRNHEMETVTPAAVDTSILVPDYLDTLARDPDGGGPVVLVTDQSQIGGGSAAFAAVRIAVNGQTKCRYINRSAGGADSVPTATSIPVQRSGCVQAGATVGPFTKGDYVAFLRVG